ncbi:hypothetical protein ACMYR2_3733 [Nitrobacter sp. TKz-YC01]
MAVRIRGRTGRSFAERLDSRTFSPGIGWLRPSCSPATIARRSPVYVVFAGLSEDLRRKVDFTLSNSSTFTPLRRMM